MADDSKAPAEWASIAAIQEWPKNPKPHPDSNVQAIARSIARFGFIDPLTVWRSRGWIAAGHGRARAAALLMREDAGRRLSTDAPGPGVVPVRFVEFASEAEFAAYAIADNRLTEVNPMDGAAVADILQEIADAGGDVQIPGYEEADIAAMLADEPSGMDGEDGGAEAPPVEAVSRTGEVYELGPHRLVCGDSRDAGVWAALLPGGERLQMVWTDPPYGVSQSTDHLREWDGGKKRDRAAHGIENDTLSAADLEQFLRDALGITAAHTAPGGAWYVAAPPGPLHLIFGTILKDLDIWHQTLQWVKDQFVLGRSDYHYRTEPIFYGWVPGAAHYFIDERTHDSVLEFARPKRSNEHPTMKPVELVEYCIGNSSKPGWIVGEPFGGSGTTLIACAKTGRIARVIEIDPRYCDVIRRRWTKYALSAGVDPGPGRLD